MVGGVCTSVESSAALAAASGMSEACIPTTVSWSTSWGNPFDDG